MEINETTILDDRGFVKINGDEAKSFLQNIVTNDIEKITDSLTLFSSIFTPQGKYLYEFFILKFEDGYLLECEKKLTSEIIKIFDFYKLRTKVNLIDEFEIDSKVLKDSKVICDKYNSRPDRPDQSLYMIQFSLDLGKDISVAWEADMDGEDYCLSTRLVRKHLNDELKVENDLVEELWLYKNWDLPLVKTHRKEMIEDSIKYDFVDIMNHTWSCRFPKENGDICDGCIGEVDNFDRVSNYKDILCMTI